MKIKTFPQAEKASIDSHIKWKSQMFLMFAENYECRGDANSENQSISTTLLFW